MSDDKNTWREAVLDACTTVWVDPDENDPRKTVESLIKRNIEWALDPAVSEAAVRLGEVSVKESQTDLASEVYEAIRLRFVRDPAYPDAWDWLAVYLRDKLK
jgi:hypothetical protein